MRLDRQLARILGAVIVMIVAYLAPSAAKAHPGHHPAPAAVAASDAASAKSDARATVAAPAAATKAIVVALYTADPDASAPGKMCHGVCCCLAGMSCSAHALTPDAGSAVMTRKAATLSAIPDDLARPGVDPEALPKPPRPFA